MKSLSSTRIRALVMLAFAAPLAYGVQAQSEKEARKDLEAMYSKMDDAIKTKDQKALAAVLASDYTSKRSDGKVSDRAQSIADIAKSLAAVKEIESSNTTIDTIKMIDGNEVVEETQVVKAGIEGPDGKPHEVVITGKSRDTWTHTGNNWMLKHTEDISQSVTVDGQPAG